MCVFAHHGGFVILHDNGHHIMDSYFNADQIHVYSGIIHMVSAQQRALYTVLRTEFKSCFFVHLQYSSLSLLQLMSDNQYLKYYKALEIYTRYFNSLDIIILFFLSQQYHSNERLLYLQICFIRIAPHLSE